MSTIERDKSTPDVTVPVSKKPCKVCGEFKQWTKKEVRMYPLPFSNDASISMPPNSSVRPENVTSHETTSVSTPPSTPTSFTVTPTPSPISNETKMSGEALECPPDDQILGNSTWTFLHTMASYYPERPSSVEQSSVQDLMHSLSHLYPCSFCAKHLGVELEKRPVRAESQSALELWMCELHNEVNERLGKRTFDCLRVHERWRGGPASGSCD